MGCPARLHRVRIAAHAGVDERAVARVYRQEPTTSVYERVAAAAVALGMIAPPTRVDSRDEATSVGRLTPDTVDVFLNDCMVFEPQAFVMNEEIYRLYVTWCDLVGGLKPLESRVLGRKLAAYTSISLGKKNGKRGVIGLRPRVAEDPPVIPATNEAPITGKTMDETFVEWWSRERPERFTLEAAEAALIPPTTTSEQRIFRAGPFADLHRALRQFTKRRLFTDGWFYEPTPRLRIVASPKPIPSALRTPPTSVVYFVQSISGGPIKIGTTTDVRARLATLQTASAERLRLLVVQPGDGSDEKQLHEHFAALRISGGEWFHPGEDLIAYIDSVVLRSLAP